MKKDSDIWWGLGLLLGGAALLAACGRPPKFRTAMGVQVYDDFNFVDTEIINSVEEQVVGLMLSKLPCNREDLRRCLEHTSLEIVESIDPQICIEAGKADGKCTGWQQGSEMLVAAKAPCLVMYGHELMHQVAQCCIGNNDPDHSLPVWDWLSGYYHTHCL